MRFRDWLTTTEPGQTLLFVGGIVVLAILFIGTCAVVGALT